MDLHDRKGHFVQIRLQTIFGELGRLTPDRQLFICEVLESFLRVEAQRRAPESHQDKLDELADLLRTQPPDRQDLLVQIIEHMNERLLDGLDN